MHVVMDMPLIALAPAPSSNLSVATGPRGAGAHQCKDVLLATAAGTEHQSLHNQLKAEGYRVRQVFDGREALDVLLSPSAPSIALLDESLPGLSGADVVRCVRERGTERYVYSVLLVAHAGREATMLGREAGADDCLGKPVHTRELQLYLHSAERIVEMERRLAEARDRFRTQATRDALTGLSNRMDIMEILDRELGRTAREGNALAVIMVDLDHFKRINDTYGHPAGDTVISEAARRMSEAVRVYDAVGRYGGEEFIVVLPGADLQTAGRVAERLRRAICERSVASKVGALDVSASLGVAATNGNGLLSAEELVKRADTALYQAKEEGRNRVVLGSAIQPPIAAMAAASSMAELHAEVI